MSVKFSPFGNSQISDASGNPAVGWTIGTYTAGSSARLATYTDSTGSTAQTADIVLNALGLPTNGQIWLTAGSSYKFIVKNASGVTQFTVDNIAGVNDTGAATISQWQSSNMTPTFVSTTSFTVPGDQTTELHVGRKAQFTTTAGTVYGTIATAVYATLTTVTVSLDSGSLDSGLSAINLSILRADASALPKTAYNVTTLNATGNTVLGDASTDTLNVGNGGIIKDASGNTGIGTTPRVKFDVGGEAAAAVQLRVVPTAGSVAGIGAFLRNDGTSTYLLLTASGDAYGTFNAFRPLAITNATGKAALDGTATSLSTATGTAPSYSARAWVNFNGAGTTTNRGSGNVSSITKVTTGRYIVNFATAMPDANYSFSLNSKQTTSTGNLNNGCELDDVPTTSALAIRTGDRAANTLVDHEYISVVINR